MAWLLTNKNCHDIYNLSCKKKSTASWLENAWARAGMHACTYACRDRWTGRKHNASSGQQTGCQRHENVGKCSVFSSPTQHKNLYLGKNGQIY